MICPTLKGFSFTGCDPDNEDPIGVTSTLKRKLDDYLALPVVSDAHVFDMMSALSAVQDGGDKLDDSGHNPITDFGLEDIVEEEALPTTGSSSDWNRHAARCQFKRASKSINSHSCFTVYAAHFDNN